MSLAPDLTLCDVLYIPSFRVNLISVSSLLHGSDFSITFHTNSFVIQDKYKSRMIGQGDLWQGLYVLQQDQVPAAA